MSPPLRQYLPDYAYLLAVAGISLSLDQFSKAVVRLHIGFTDIWMPWDWLMPYARVVHWKNTGAAFGMFQSGALFFTILGILVTLAILNYFPLVSRVEKFLRLAIALQLGGALGNLVDRLTIGYVTDWISVGDFPVFNLADASISVGVALIIIPMLPLIPAEMHASNLMKAARQHNIRRRLTPPIPAKTDEPLPLGLAGVLLAASPAVQAYQARQHIHRIRQRRAARKSGHSRG